MNMVSLSDAAHLVAPLRWDGGVVSGGFWSGES
jgi:hypothetical protein